MVMVIQQEQLDDNLPPISQIIQIRRTRLAEYCWVCKNELISDVLHFDESFLVVQEELTSPLCA